MLRRVRIAESSTLFLATLAAACVLAVAFIITREQNQGHLLAIGIALLVLYVPLAGILVYLQRGKIQ